MTEREHTRTKIKEFSRTVSELDSRFRSWTPEQIRTPDIAEKIRNNFRDGVIAMSLFMIMDAEVAEDEPKDHMFDNCWSLKDFARTVFTGALPAKQVWAHYRNQHQPVPMSIIMADQTDWWEKASEGQKEAIFEVLGLKWSAVHEPTEDLDTAQVIFRGEDAWVEGEDIEGYIAFPTVLWNPHHGICITAVPFEKRQKDYNEDQLPDFPIEALNGINFQDTD